MDSSRPFKRARTGSKRPSVPRSDAFHDQVPILQNFDVVHSTDGRLLRRGQTVLGERTAEPIPGAWEQFVTWEPPDDPEYALDPDGEWYDEVVEADVMQDGPEASAKVKPKRSRVSVS